MGTTTALEGVLGAIFGLLLGSTSSALSFRIPRKQPLFLDRSRCFACSAQIAAWDNIPILSYLFLRGKCRSCGAAIPSGYLWSEVMLGGVYAMLALRHGIGVTFLLLGTAIFVAFTAAQVDLEFHKIPNRLTYPGLAVVVLIGAASTVWNPRGGYLYREILAALFVFLLFILAGVASRGGMGMGDGKLAALGAAALSPLGWMAVLYFILVAFMGGSLVGGYLILTGRASRKSRLPFGPYLALALVVVALV